MRCNYNAGRSLESRHRHSPKGWFGKQFVGALGLGDDGRDVTFGLLEFFVAGRDLGTQSGETVLLLSLLDGRDI